MWIIKCASKFLDATTHLYKRSCPSVCPSVHRSVGLSRVIFEQRILLFLRLERLQMTDNNNNHNINNNNDDENDKWSHLMYTPGTCSCCFFCSPAFIFTINIWDPTNIFFDYPLFRGKSASFQWTCHRTSASAKNHTEFGQVKDKEMVT